MGAVNLEQVVQRVTGLLASTPLIDADRALDEARRVCWASYFEGIDGAQAADALGVSGTGQSIATALAGLTMDQLNAVIERVRRVGWIMVYSERPTPACADRVSADDRKRFH
jgi:hypothetical protein